MLRITTTFLPDGTQTVPYSSVQLAGSGGLVPYTWSISPNSASGLPAGMTLTSGGLISGTPTAGGAGVYDVTIQMTDFAGRSIVREFVFTIN